MASIKLKNVTKSFNQTTAINNLSLEIRDGEFFCVLGPPGAGKTTLLRLIVGLETLNDGVITIGDEVVNELHPSQRDIAMIFQNLALYPDKSVFDNIAFPLKKLDLGEEEINKKVVDIAKQLKIDWLLEKLPSQLSGGERQRVAIGRAIIRQPKAYLMDEPLSNLDALLRLEMRVSLKELQENLKETFVYVTHDQVEALSMGDRIAVLNEGALQQVGEPEAIYLKPNNIFVATILGSPPMNFLKCNFTGESNKVIFTHEAFALMSSKKDFINEMKAKMLAGSVILGIRPEDIKIYMEKNSEKVIESEIYVTEPLGNETIVDVKLGKDIIKVIADADFSAQFGQKIWLEISSSNLHLFDEKNHDCIYHISEKDHLQTF